MFNNAMLLAGVAAEPVGLIRVTSDLKVRLGASPKPSSDWERLDADSTVISADVLRVEDCPGAHLTLKRIFKHAQMRGLSFTFLIEPDAPGDDGAVSRLRGCLLSKRLRPVILAGDMELRQPQDARVRAWSENEVSFDYSSGRSWEEGLYLAVEERPVGSKAYYLSLECHVGLVR